jgi:hypothetical protein
MRKNILTFTKTNLLSPGHDLRLERTLESALMVMEALEGHNEKFKYDVFGHSGEESALQFVKINHVCLRFVITFTIKKQN